LHEQVDVDGYPVRIKVGAGRAKVEHDDAVRVSRRTGRSRREVVAAAEDAWRRRGHEAPVAVPLHGHGHGDHGHAHDEDGSHLVDAGLPPVGPDDDAAS
jgi:hypothetical protein